MAQVVIQLVKTRFSPLLVTEYLDYFLSLYHFLNITIHSADGLLLFVKIHTAFTADCAHGKNHYGYHQQHQQSQQGAENHHHREYAHDSDKGRDKLGKALA